MQDYLTRKLSGNTSTHPGYGWYHKTTNGSTIQDALNYASAQPAGDENASELWPDIVAVGAVYGDSNGNYAKFMLQNAGQTYPEDAEFLWNQPFSDSGLVENATVASSANSSSPTSHKDNGALPAFGYIFSSQLSWLAYSLFVLGFSTIQSY